MCVSRNKPLIMHKTGCILGEQIFLVPYSPKAWEERHELDTALNRVFFMLLCACSQPNLWCIHLKACCRSLCLMDTIDPGMTSYQFRGTVLMSLIFLHLWPGTVWAGPPCCCPQAMGLGSGLLVYGGLRASCTTCLLHRGGHLETAGTSCRLGWSNTTPG